MVYATTKIKRIKSFRIGEDASDKNGNSAETFHAINVRAERWFINIVEVVNYSRRLGPTRRISVFRKLKWKQTALDYKTYKIFNDTNPCVVRGAAVERAITVTRGGGGGGRSHFAKVVNFLYWNINNHFKTKAKSWQIVNQNPTV